LVGFEVKVLKLIADFGCEQVLVLCGPSWGLRGKKKGFFLFVLLAKKSFL